ALSSLDLEGFESIAGQGLCARHGGQECRLGRREWLAEGEFAKAILAVPAADSGLAEVWLARRDLLGRVVLRDDIRPQAKGLVQELRQEGLRTIVLTGDRKVAAENLERELQLDDVRAELKPEQKLREIHALTKAGQRVAMVGD